MLVLKGEIGKDITAKQVSEWLERNGDAPFDVLIDSPGGSVEEMLAIDAMLQHAPVRQAVVKYAGSAASVLAVGIKNRRLHPDVKPGDDVLMIHNPRLTALPKPTAQADELRSYANYLDAYQTLMAERYAETMNITVEQAKAAMDKETVYTPEAMRRLNIVAFATPKSNTNMSLVKKAEELLASLTGVVKAMDMPEVPEAKAEDGASELGTEDLLAEIARLKEERDNLLAEKDQYEAKIKAMEEAECKSAEAIDALALQVKAIAEKQAKQELAGKVQANANPRPSVVEPAAPKKSLTPTDLVQMQINRFAN